MRLVNATPHSVTLAVGNRQIDLPPSGIVARAREQVQVVDDLTIDSLSVPVVKIAYGDLTGLPAPDGETVYLVSSIAARAAQAAGRTDCLVTALPLRDEQGRIVAAAALGRL